MFTAASLTIRRTCEGALQKIPGVDPDMLDITRLESNKWVLEIVNSIPAMDRIVACTLEAFFG